MLTVAGAVEVLLAQDVRLASAVALPALTLPVAWSRRAPLPALWVVAVALALQGLAGGFLAGSSVTTVVVLALLLYRAARASSLAGTAVAAAAVARPGSRSTRPHGRPAKRC